MIQTDCLNIFIVIVSLALSLASCTTVRSDVDESPDVLSDRVLVIEEDLDGQVRSSWRHADDFNLSIYTQMAISEEGVPIRVSNRPRDCDQEHIKCFRDCMKSRLPSQFSHIKRGTRARGEYCADECMKKYMNCLELERVRALEFSAAGAAIAWLERHRKEVLIGTVVVIAGVAFVAVSGGTGLLILAPMVWVAS